MIIWGAATLIIIIARMVQVAYQRHRAKRAAAATTAAEATTLMDPAVPTRASAPTKASASQPSRAELEAATLRIQAIARGKAERTRLSEAGGASAVASKGSGNLLDAMFGSMAKDKSGGFAQNFNSGACGQPRMAPTHPAHHAGML